MNTFHMIIRISVTDYCQAYLMNTFQTHNSHKRFRRSSVLPIVKRILDFWELLMRLTVIQQTNLLISTIQMIIRISIPDYWQSYRSLSVS